ncbi:transcription factor TFIIIB component B'' homolog isoform X3 [Epinephelus fuscoguttatus]|uniref:transcription factor TFIIIB component B'' homolog isoform X3 n=1 Tax=Epinephelus fuscoguttatus TaxID=293821 RepID=UPI0020D0D2B4|nr:transcription factor TFIIIB component B'' homolog isoform X3 [Epinephelus fuscoguttatus]
MFRRSRFSIRPNVGTAGRTAATPQEAPSANQEASENPKDVSESSTATAVADNKSVVTPSEKPTASGDGNDQNGEGTSSSAALQRRKRFSIKPKVAPGRPSTLARAQKSPVKAVSETSTEVPVSDLDKSTTSSQTGPTAAPQRLQSPRRRRPSEESKQPKIQPKPTLIPSDSSEPSAPPTAEDSPEQPHLPTDSGKELESTPGSQVKEVLSKIPDKVPPSLPDKEAIEISEKAKTLVSSKCGLSVSAPAFSLSRLLNDPSDLQRLAKAQKLRELLKQEMNKEKKMKKAKARTKEYTIDPAKMTMRDLIRYLPLSNPMTSNLEESAQENETVVPPSPAREESPERAQQPEVPPKIASPREEEEAEPEAEAEEEEDDGIMVPQVKVAEDGSLIIDEESLTVEVQRAKGPNPAQDRDPIFERGSTTTYSSFRKGTYSKPWSSEETDMFFLAISMVGTDFSMICQLFPHRARSEIKNKFKKEERENAWRIDKAFRERRKLDIEYFSKLLEKILEVQKNRKKLKSLAGKKSPKKPKRKAKDKKAARKLSVVEEEDEEEQNEIPDLEEEEGEKENEDLCNEGGTTVAKPKKKRKRKSKQDDTTEEPNDKKNKTGQKSNEQDEAYIPEDTEAALPEDRPNSDMAEKTENVNAAKNTTIKPAKLSRGRAPTPLLPLGRKWGKKPPPPSTKANDSAPDKGDESVIDGASEEQVNKDASPNKRKSANDDISSEEEDATVQPPRPTRYGRVPKPTKPLNYPAKEAAHSSETIPASPAGSTASAARPKPKGTAKRGRSSKPQSAQESKRPKLVTLRASQSEYSDDEDEMQREEEEVEEEEQPACSYSKDSTAPVFVPASLRSPHPVISEVEETMEEDVIDFLSSEHTEVSEDASYNEAAQTLLTIGNLTHLSQSAVNQITIQDHITVAGTTSESVNETSQHQEEEIGSVPAAQEEKSAIPVMSEMFGHGVTETSENVTTVELQNSAADNDDVPNIKFSDQSAGSDMDPSHQLHSSPEGPKNKSPQTRKGCLPKVKPKPNLGQASRTGQSKSIPETSTVQTAEESCTVAPDHSQASETLSPTEEAPKTAECSQELLKDTSCIEAKLTGEPFGIQPRSGDHVKSGAATSDQSTSGNQNLSEAQFEPSREQATTDTRPTSESTDEKVMSHFGTTENSCKNALTSDSAATESQVGQGLNRDSVPAQESSDHSAPCVTPVEELPVSQKEESKVASACQTRRSRFQKVRPNLAQTSRTVRSKPETTKATMEKDSNQTPKPKFNEKTIVEVEAEPTCTTSPENPSQSHDPASDLTPSLELGCTLPSTDKLSTTEDKKTNVGVVCQVESDDATSDQSTSGNQNLSEAQFEPSREQATTDTRPTSESTDEKVMSHFGTTENSCKNALTSDSAATESQVGQGLNRDSVPAQESSDHSAPCVTPVEELPVSQKEESKVASTCQTRRSRFQKVRPNLAQTSRTVRSKPETTKATMEKDSNQTPKPKVHEKTIVEVEAEPTCTTSPENPSQSHDPASDLTPSLDLGCTLPPTEEMSSIEDKKTNVGVAGRVGPVTATSDQSFPENQNLIESQFEPSRGQATTDTRPTSESTDEKLMSHFGTNENSFIDPLTSESAVMESQVGQGSKRDSAPNQESSAHPAPCVTSVEELPVGQKEESKVASACQTRRSRFQKVKPNLAQTSRTVRSKPETTKVTLEKDSNQTPKPKVHEKTIVEVEAEPTCTTSPENPSQSHDPASDLTPSLDVGCTLPPTEEMSSIEDKKTNVEVVGQVASDGATSAQSTSENCFSSEAQLESSSKQATTETRTISESTHEKQMSHVGITESICNDPLTPDSALSESQVGQASDTAPIQGSSGHPALCATPAPALPVSQKEKSEVESTCQSRRGRLQKVKPKPNLPQRTVRSKPQTTKDPASPMQFAEKPCSPTSGPESTANTTAQVEAKPTCSTILPEAPSRIKNTDTASVSLPSLEVCSTHKTTDELFSTEEQKTDVVCRLEPESSEQNVSQRRQRFPKIKPKPNLGSSLRTTHTKLQSNDIIKPSEQCHTGTSLTSEQQPLENNNAQTEVEPTTDSEHLTSTHCTLHSELSSTMLAPAESGKSLDSKNDKDTSSDIITASWVAENQSVLTDSVLENESTEKPTVEEESTMDKMSNYDKVEAGPASQWDCQQDTSIRATETNTQPTDNPTAVSDIQCSEGGSAESKIESALPTNTQYTTDPKEGAQLPQSENDSEAQSQDSVQQCSETNQTAAQSTDNRQSEPVDCPSRKPALTRRGRLIKPKPSLGRSSRPRQPQQVQHTKQAEAEGMDASVYKPVSEHQPEILEPAEGAIEQCSDPNSPPNDSGSSPGCLTQVMEQLNQHDSTPDVAGSSLGCVKQVPDSFSQDASTSSTGGTQSHPNLTIFPDMLPQQEPSDPDEPFFILSLTEIPVCSAGEVLGSVPEPLPYLPVTEASVEQQSNPGESLAAAGGELLSNVAVPVSMAESGETGLINVIDIGPDPTAYIGSIMEHPVDPHESTTVHPSKLPETIENNETEIAPTKQRLMSIRGRGPAKLQVEPNTTKRKEASKALAAKEAEPIPIQTNTTLHSELPGPSVQPKAFDDIVTEQQKGSGDHVHAEKETLTGGEDPENSSSGALIKRTRGTTGRNRKPKETNDTAPSDSPPGKAASKGAKVKTQRAARKRSTPASVASTSYDVAPTPRPTQPTEETHSTSSTASPTHTQVHLEQTSEHSRLCSDTAPITPLCPAEVSASQQSLESSSIEEEPTSVSQYFLSDIFTEVEDG